MAAAGICALSSSLKVRIFVGIRPVTGGVVASLAVLHGEVLRLVVVVSLVAFTQHSLVVVGCDILDHQADAQRLFQFGLFY